MSLKMTLYTVMVTCFAIAGVLDLIGGAYKLGILSLVYAAANALIFFWR